MQLFFGWKHAFIKAVSSSPAFYLLDISGGEKRQVQESSIEKSIRSSKEGFVESLWTNVALIRNIIKARELKVEALKLGKKTKTKYSRYSLFFHLGTHPL